MKHRPWPQRCEKSSVTISMNSPAYSSKIYQPKAPARDLFASPQQFTKLASPWRPAAGEQGKNTPARSASKGRRQEAGDRSQKKNISGRTPSLFLSLSPSLPRHSSLVRASGWHALSNDSPLLRQHTYSFCFLTGAGRVVVGSIFGTATRVNSLPSGVKRTMASTRG